MELIDGFDCFCYNSVMKSKIICLALFAFVVVAGCARFPEGLTPIEVREMTVRIEFAGPINDNYHYFAAIDTSGDEGGPVPVFPGFITADSWVTGSATHYVQYTQGTYEVYKILNLQPLEDEYIGVPLRMIMPSGNSNVLQFTIDLNEIEAEADFIAINIIAVDDPRAEFRLIDGLGSAGNDFLNLDITSYRIYTNSESQVPEMQNDVLDQNRIIQPSTDQTRPLDIVDWTITINT